MIELQQRQQVGQQASMWSSTRQRTWLHELATAAGLFVLFCLLLASIQYATPDLPDNDGFYHIKMGQLIREQGLHPEFIWLPMSILNQQDFYDHHLLYHVYLALFVGDGSSSAMLAGAKLASVIMPALAFTMIWGLLRSQKVPWAALWAIGLCAISYAFLYRMSIPRAQSASLLVLALAMYLTLSRRYVLLIPTGFVYVWLYNAFPLLIAVVGAEAVATFLLERKIAWRGLTFAAIGIVLGLVVNPYFPVNVDFIIHHLLPKVGQPETSVGNEWYPYETWTMVMNSGAALALMLLGFFAIGWRGQRFDRTQLTAFVLAVFFGLLLLKARRFVEYFPPFALIFAAFCAGPLLRDLLRDSSTPRWLARLLPATSLLLLVVMTGLTLREAQDDLRGSKPAATFAEASAYLRQHAPAGSMIFQTDWDDFPRLFFYNSQNTYTIGLDPTYMQLHDAELYDLWVDISRGKVKNPSSTIRETFHAQYVISDLKHENFMERAEKDPNMQEVHRDAYAVVYQILP
ncbi:MAG: hypothetical protein Fur005_32030 [Roseiflexaceae bacterium]